MIDILDNQQKLKTCPRKDMSKRFCVNCKSNTTYVTPKTNYHVWHYINNEFWCHKCYAKTKMAENRITGRWNIKEETKEVIKARNARRIRFLDKYPRLKENPRTYQCSICGNKIGDEYINCYGKKAVTKKIDFHHINYHEDNPLKDTIELCSSCHMKETNKKIKEIRKYATILR